MNLKIPSWWRDVFFLFLWFFCWSRSMNVRVMDTWDLEKKASFITHHVSACPRCQRRCTRSGCRGFQVDLGIWLFHQVFLWVNYTLKKPSNKTKISRVFRALLKMMIFPTSPGGIYWKNPGEKTLCSWKNAGRWSFPLGRNAQKAVSFRGPGTPLGGGEVGG